MRYVYLIGVDMHSEHEFSSLIKANSFITELAASTPESENIKVNILISNKKIGVAEINEIRKLIKA